METRTALVGAVVLATVLATAGAAGVVTAGSSTQADAQSNKTIQVSAAGQVQAQADRAVVRVAVVATGDDIETVREHLATNASSMQKALQEMGIGSGQIQTAYYDISSERRYGGEKGEPRYRAIHSFVVTVEDPGRVGQVIDTAVNNGASEVDGVQFTLSPDKRKQLKKQALKQAMDTARDKAGAIASSEDLTITGVARITTSQYSSSPYQVKEVALASGGGTSIEGGPVGVSATVTVVYNVE
ncbi:MAG: SIMPL domain-containing protein [Haloarculaceae archaeon]